jgi:hypothetical protein
LELHRPIDFFVSIRYNAAIDSSSLLGCGTSLTRESGPNDNTSGAPAQKYCRSMHDVTIELARRIVASSWPAVNDTVGDEAVRAVINWLGSALIGTRESFAEFDEASTGIGIEASALVMGRGFDALDIAAMTAAGAEALCYVDTHVPSMLSPSSAVGAALLPLAEHLTSPAQHSYTRTCSASRLHAVPPCRSHATPRIRRLHSPAMHWARLRPAPIWPGSM